MVAEVIFAKVVDWYTYCCLETAAVVLLSAVGGFAQILQSLRCYCNVNPPIKPFWLDGRELYCL